MDSWDLTASSSHQGRRRVDLPTTPVSRAHPSCTQATMTEATYQRGQKVRLKAASDRVGMVEEVIASPDGWSYKVFFGATSRHLSRARATRCRCRARLPRSRAAASALAVRVRRGIPRLSHIREAEPTAASTVYSYLASRTRLLAYQFKPALQALDNPYSRILIADEVGLGKTIEAGIVLTELHMRQSLGRVLIVCPSALRSKWKQEMRNRFDWDFDSRRRRAAEECNSATARAPGKPLRLIASLEGLRSQRDLGAPPGRATGLRCGRHRRGSPHAEPRAAVQPARTPPLGRQRHAGVSDRHAAEPRRAGFLRADARPGSGGVREFADFETQIEPNAYLNAAIRALRTTPPTQAALAELIRAVEREPAAHRPRLPLP